MRARLDGRGEPSAAVGAGAGAEVDAARPAQPTAPEAQPTAAEAAESQDERTPPVPYVELHVHSAYSFLDGVSMPEELVAEAERLGLSGLAITDHDGLYAAVRMAEEIAHRRKRDSFALASIYGAELSLGLSSRQNGVPDPEGEHLLVLARGARGYHRLAAALTEAQLAGGQKGRPLYSETDIQQLSGDVVVLTGCRKSLVRRALEPRRGVFDVDAAAASIQRLQHTFGSDAVYVELFHHGDPLDDDRNSALAEAAARAEAPLVATSNAHYATPQEFPLAQAVAAVRARRSLDEAESWLPAAPAAHLHSGTEMRARFGHFAGAVENTLAVASECSFDLRSVSPKLPTLDLPGGVTPMQRLRELVWEGAARKYSRLTPEHRSRILHELEVIEQKDFPGYFLIVYDIVQFARSRGILCQGRGSAAASAVCYLLDITAVDAIYYRLPFERFLSKIRDEEPDIDVDFDSNRREEVIQYVYATYGRRNAAQVANVISFTPRNAVRDMAKALGFGQGQQDAWSKAMERGFLRAGTGGGAETASGGGAAASTDQTARAAATAAETEAGIPAAVVRLAQQLQGKPRHLGIHSGGMVLTDRPIGEVVPIEHATMPGRTVLQWDKDDCEWMGLVKFDLLGLGILSAIQYCFDQVAAVFGRRLDLDAIPKEEPAVYEMLCRADAIGVFQVESRAQLGLLPRLQPRCFYDLAIQVAMIRPGPIQGGAVHPFVERRNDPSKIRFLHPSLEPILGRTLGIPVFQEQIIAMAVALSDLGPEEADLLRRAFGSKRGQERIESIRARMFAGMRERGMTEEAIAAVYAQIEAFANFGFAESHSLSFALLVYASAWLKLHYPAAYLAGLLRAQPMGFYSAASLIADARRHGVRVLRPDVQRSGVDAQLEVPGGPGSSSPDPDGPAVGGPGGSGGPAPGGPGDHPDSPCQADPNDLPAHRCDTAAVVRLGLAAVRGIGRELAQRIVDTREADGPFASMSDLVRRTGLSEAQVEALATAGAFDSLGVGRREALWQAGAAAQDRPEFLEGSVASVPVPLFEMPSERELLAADLWATGVSADDHVMRHLRTVLARRGVVRASDLQRVEAGRRIEVAGVVIHRQRPSTAGGVVFLNLEDETGMVNVICSAGAWTRFRQVARRSAALVVRGMLERSAEGVANVVADWFEPLDAGVGAVSRDFR